MLSQDLEHRDGDEAIRACGKLFLAFLEALIPSSVSSVVGDGELEVEWVWQELSEEAPSVWYSTSGSLAL